MVHPSSELVIDPVLIRKHDVSGPRYTSYPTADRFVEAYGEGSLRHRLEERAVGSPGGLGATGAPLSLYVHLPFCDTVCYYCGCNKVVTRDHGRSEKYINYLGREMAMVAAALGGRARHRLQPAALGRRHADLPLGRGDARAARPDRRAVRAARRAPSCRWKWTRAASSPAAWRCWARSASTACRSACRISTRRCSRRCTASRAWRRRGA